MDLDDDELWATQYSNRYVKKSKIEKRIEELDKQRIDYLKIGWYSKAEITLYKIEELKQLLGSSYEE